MKAFDIKRFGRVMKWELANNRTRLIKGSLIWFAVTFMLFMFANVGSGNAMAVANTGTGFFWFATLAIGLISGSLIQNCMKTRQQRIDYMMLPASNLEKFMARYLDITLISFLGFCVMFIAADVLQYIVMLVLDPNEATLIVSHFHESNMPEHLSIDSPWLASLSVAILFWWSHSVYMLGGMFFRKLGWLWTTLIMQFAGMVFTVGIAWLSMSLMKSLYGENIRIVLDDGADGWIKIAYFMILGGLIVFNYWFSFRLFKRMQVINNKWFNW